MYHTISEFLEDWKNESSGTQRAFEALTDESLSQRVYAEGRALGKIAWHIVVTIGEMAGRVGAKVACPEENSPVPSSAAEIASAYRTAAESLSEDVQKNWTDAMLSDVFDMYGEQWTRAKTLYVLIKHEIHHRAQVLTLMRQAGLKIPGIYGPSKEEWANYGMPPQD